MPTTRPRHTITETVEVARALDDAANRWPGIHGRGRLLLRLVERGHEAIEAELRDEVERRRAALRDTSGVLTGVYPPGYLNDLRNDWPE
jgi:hypothetical protein